MMNYFTCTICNKTLEAETFSDISSLIYSHYRRAHKLKSNLLNNIIPKNYRDEFLKKSRLKNRLDRAIKISVNEHNTVLLEEIGNVEYDKLVTCEICGVKANSLFSHITRTHNMKISEYTVKYSSNIRSYNNLKKSTEYVKGDKNAMFQNGDPKNSPFSKEFYLNKNLDELSAEKEAKTFQKRMVINRPHTTNVEYYMNKFNVSRINALKMLKNRQTTNSIEQISKRKQVSIHEAKIIRDNITYKWIETLKNKPLEEIIDINRRKSAFNISNISIKFFDELIKCSGINRTECTYGICGEFSIKSDILTPCGLPKFTYMILNGKIK